jgi:DNA modification methylase
MSVIRNKEAQLVLTSPPYWPDGMEPVRGERFGSPETFVDARRDVLELADSLEPIFKECFRVLASGGVLAMQTRDLPWGGRFIPLAHVHREIAESTGLIWIGTIDWHKIGRSSPSRQFRKMPRVGTYRPDYVEEIQLFCKGQLMPRDQEVDLPPEEIEPVAQPLWRMGGAGSGRLHPHQSPKALGRRMVALYTVPGDLVVDPFAGSGLFLKEAFMMGRSAIGYEIDADYYDVARRSLKECRRFVNSKWRAVS